MEQEIVYFLTIGFGITAFILAYSIVGSSALASSASLTPSVVKPKQQIITTDENNIFDSGQTELGGKIMENQGNMKCLATADRGREVGWRRCYDPRTFWSVGIIQVDNQESGPEVMIRNDDVRQCLQDDKGLDGAQHSLIVQVCDSSHKPSRWIMEPDGAASVKFKNSATGRYLAFSGTNKWADEFVGLDSLAETDIKGYEASWKLYSKILTQESTIGA
jgi:hypothetical protein